MFNHNKTYISFEMGKKGHYNFTGTDDICDHCNLIEYKIVLIQGYSGKYDNWKRECSNHILYAKSQHCNACNPKAKIGAVPQLCNKCVFCLLDGYEKLKE